MWAFYIYYTKTFADIGDPLSRFARSVVASAADVADRKAVMAWYQAMSPKARTRSRDECLEIIMQQSLKRTGRKLPRSPLPDD